MQKTIVNQEIFPAVSLFRHCSLPFFFTHSEILNGNPMELEFLGLFPGGVYLVTMVTVVGSNPEIISDSASTSYRMGKTSFFDTYSCL